MMLIFTEIEKDGILKDITTSDGYINAWSKLIVFAESDAITNCVLKEYIIRQLIDTKNAFSYKCQTHEKIGNSLYNSALYDVKIFWDKYLNFDFESFTRMHNLPNLSEYFPTETISYYSEYDKSIKNMVVCDDPATLIELIAKHINKFGYGETSKYIAFKWSGQLKGIKNTEIISFDNLVGLEFQKGVLIENTKSFLEGKSANNVLLCGDSGTGKSSSVKALLSLFQNDGLKIIEFPRHYLKDISVLFKQLYQSKGKFIIFLDDLSFENDDLDYKYLKIAMEGQIEKHSNILIYATSNRRNLVKETWNERENTEIHARDLMQEKMSLAERFGIKLTFTSPSQDEYLSIVESILSQNNIKMTDEIKKKAIMWEMRYNGRSGRTAMQFSRSLMQGE